MLPCNTLCGSVCLTDGRKRYFPPALSGWEAAFVARESVVRRWIPEPPTPATKVVPIAMIFSYKNRIVTIV